MSQHNTSTFHGYNGGSKYASSENFLYEHNEKNTELFASSKPGIYSSTYLTTKFLNKDYSRCFAEPKVNYNMKNMERGYYPGNIMSDITYAEQHYQKLNEMFKLE